MAYHGSPYNFTEFKTKEVFLAKSAHEARRYGPNLYKVHFEGKPMFETDTIYVVSKDQIVRIEKE